MKNMTVTELKEKLDTKDEIFLIDVREFNELSIASVIGAHHIPMMQIPLKYQELEKNKPIAVICHTGGRSAQVCMYLDQYGFDTYNVVGGIHAWALEIDSTIPTY